MSSSSIKKALEEAIDSLTIGQLRRLLDQNGVSEKQKTAWPDWVDELAKRSQPKRLAKRIAHGSLKQQILGELGVCGGRASANSLIDSLGSNKRFTHWTLNSLLRKGLVVRHGKRGSYTWSLP